MHVTCDEDGIRALKPAESSLFAAEMLNLFSDLIGGRLAQAATVRRLLAEGAGEMRAWLLRDRLAGALIYLWLSPAGVEALLGGRFDGLDPAAAHLARRADAAGLYAWACAGAGDDARRAVMRTWSELKAGPFAALPFFARAATAAGRRALVERLHCLPVDGAAGLFRADAVLPRRRAA